MENKKFEDYGFKPSAVIAGLNKWYETGDKHALIRFADHFFYDHDKAIDAAIKYLRSMDIFYQPGMKWDDVKFNLNSRACLAEFGFNSVRDAWPKVNPAIDQRKFRDGEIRDYILKRVDMNGIKIPESFRDPTASVENLIAYLFALLIQGHRNTELAKEIQDQYREKNKELQKMIDIMEAEAKEKELKNEVIIDTLRDNLVDSVDQCQRLKKRVRLLEARLKLNSIPPLDGGL